MKVAMYYKNCDVRIEEYPVPEIDENEIMMKVMASGICGSDVMEWYRIKKAPLVLGHEVSGTVEKTGKNVRGFKKGERIVVTHHVACGTCQCCKEGNGTVCDMLKTTKFYPGGFAEYLRVPKINISKGTLKLPDNVSFEEGTFVEPLGCVVRGQNKADVRKNHSVLVLGSGISGLLHINLAKSKGCKVFATDISEFRLKMAKKFGADITFDALKYDVEEFKKKNNGKLADRVIVSTGAPSAIVQAFNSVEKGGTILLFAPTSPNAEVLIPVNDLWSKCATVTTTYAAVKEDLEEALDLISKKKVNVKDMVTHNLTLDYIQKGFNLVLRPENSIKVIIEPHK
ncbi:MAG: alcohol dehydrogenase catalytic domain-containing protein [Candidatus Aenigmarchaeota archaeon]|nr:alcohol dehydrogenase catalytic domain-containing protein [Candidatus Aenigmarchaeota archaeon]